MSKYPKNGWKLMKIANIDRESLHNFWTTQGISMKFTEKMCFMIILKVTKNQHLNLSLEDTLFEKPQGDSNNYGILWTWFADLLINFGY